MAALLLVPGQAAAQSQWEQQVLDQIRTASELFSSEGYAQVGESRTGSLNDEASEDVNLTLQAGVSYFLVGVCDNDCADMDLTLLDESGTEIGSDYEDDAVPMMDVTPSRTQAFRIRVYMVSCASEPCFYGVGVFSQQAAGATVAGRAGGPSTQSYQGQLEKGDSQLEENEYYDVYEFQGSIGDARSRPLGHGSRKYSTRPASGVSWQLRSRPARRVPTICRLASQPRAPARPSPQLGGPKGACWRPVTTS
jgi:hypothetical protein